VLRLERLERSYTQGNRRIEVLMGTSASFYPGKTVALLGPSGAGKSTLLHIAGLLERPDKGSVVINGIDCGSLPDKEQTRMRRMEVGFVYQFHHLLPEFSALENVVLPQLILGLSREEAETRSKQLLKSLGLEERWDHRPGDCPCGRQRPQGPPCR
jgi:lipoprotein-releasing system ATP-binding protein